MRVMAFSGLVFLAGCWQSHTRDEELCAPLVPEVVCFDTPRAGEPTELEVLVDREGELCACGQMVGCEAAPRAGGRTQLRHTRCPSSPVCDDCEAIEPGHCTLPALAEGTHPMIADASGAHRLFDLEVDDDAPPSRTCVVPAPPSPDGVCWDPEPITLLRMCTRGMVPTGTRLDIYVEGQCDECRGIGACTATVEGDVITLHPTQTACPSDDCPRLCEPVCHPRCIHHCLTPPLETNLYALRVEGNDLTLALNVVVAERALPYTPGPPYTLCTRRGGR